MTTAWTRAHLARLVDLVPPAAPLIGANLGAPIAPGHDLWDFWPVQELDGTTARFGDTELWMALGAPATGRSVERHAHARIRLLERTRMGADERWSDRGDLLPDGFTPGSREWSGSAMVDAGHGRLTLFFTAAGCRGEARVTYEQRLFVTQARLDGTDAVDWTPPVQCVASDGAVYHAAKQHDGEVGQIKAFRDPAWFRDPAEGASYLLFAASLGGCERTFNGAIGLARHEAGGMGGWSLLPPLITAEGVSNELERPHIVFHAGRYYLFWSTLAHVFAPGIAAPTGLYGMVADAFAGPYIPLNGSGLVFANPPRAPAQAYSWLVSADLEVTSFIDADPDHRPTDPPAARHLIAPHLRIALAETRAWLVGDADRT